MQTVCTLDLFSKRNGGLKDTIFKSSDEVFLKSKGFAA